MDDGKKVIGTRRTALTVLAAVVVLLVAIAYSGGLFKLRPATGTANAMSYAAEPPAGSPERAR